jgi:hypothetical protein
MDRDELSTSSLTRERQDCQVPTSLAGKSPSVVFTNTPSQNVPQAIEENPYSNNHAGWLTWATHQKIARLARQRHVGSDAPASNNTVAVNFSLKSVCSV